MSEFSLSSTTSKKAHFSISSLLLSEFFLFCSFILCHPLYFLYLIFLFPYLFKLLSFLSPLFATTFLLLLVLLTFSPNLVHETLSPELSESKVSFVLGTYQAVVERLRSKVEEGGNDEFNQFEELEAYKIVFETSNFDIGVASTELEAKENGLESNEAQANTSSGHQDSVLGVSEVVSGNFNENSVVITRSESSQLIAEGNKLEVFLHQKQKFEDFAIQKGEKEVKPLSENSNKVEEQKEETYVKSGSKAMGFLGDGKVGVEDSRVYIPRMNSQKLEANPWIDANDGDGEYTPRVMDKSQSMGSNLGSFGSMRKEKEWRRTLACKLFEERRNVDGGEGMDLLWETYENDSMKAQAKSKTKKGKKGSIEYYDDEDEEEENEGQLCCLQALKFSAGKMNLGMGRPNLVKISKALKGFGWLHHVTKKKGYR
ncbi:hypothetical protein P3X46_011896 [Hevea brasiliensis]|uniref:Uncharacterized protein n=1 Tax=Hevea brasiliensis TaxID=3981 RepID=A0ABQ9M8J2_HEVBR|nr:uncharacterized protein LOC110672028 [Hevea brasiliensis]KAJ9176602.1 hypothetical protein P3X46_011896 [Hevea brasiliensis]